jgi:outer membrane biosynthesis protein TonB
MNRGSLYSVCILALFIWNCPKRQTAMRVVYEPPAVPAVAAASAESSEMLVIAEPQPPEPEEEVTPEEPAPEEKPPAKRIPRPTRSESTIDPDREAEPPSAVEVPALEPRKSPDQQAAQRQQVINLQAQVRGRLARLERSNLSADERRMAEDARTFLSQSERALGGNDFQRALILARKASMLVAVVEQ